MARKFKRVLALGDFHSGHEVGLTPTKWDPGARNTPKRFKMRQSIWKWFQVETKSLKPDIMIVNGDCIDGKGQASKASELIYTDRLSQVGMAVDIIKGIPGKPKIYMSYGTAYHTGKGEDWEDIVADKVGAVTIGGEDEISVLGTIINYKHHLGRSGIPHGRTSAVLRDALWNQLWAARGEYERADILIRSHVHYHGFAGDTDLLALTLPALQGYGTKFGTRRVTGTVDVGFVVFDIYGPNDYLWRPVIWRAPIKKARVAA